MTVEELAREILDMFEAQRKYFGDRTRENLIASKRLEGALNGKCEKILYPGLFEKKAGG